VRGRAPSGARDPPFESVLARRTAVTEDASCGWGAVSLPLSGLTASREERLVGRGRKRWSVAAGLLDCPG